MAYLAACMAWNWQVSEKTGTILAASVILATKVERSLKRMVPSTTSATSLRTGHGPHQHHHLPQVTQLLTTPPLSVTQLLTTPLLSITQHLLMELHCFNFVSTCI